MAGATAATVWTQARLPFLQFSGRFPCERTHWSLTNRFIKHWRLQKTTSLLLTKCCPNL